jgi:hypothetical protein
VSICGSACEFTLHISINNISFSIWEFSRWIRIPRSAVRS